MAIVDIADSAARSVAYGLLPMQTGMLFQSVLQLEKQGAGYDIEQIHIVLAENISPPEFAKAWSLVLRRHPALSATFRWEGPQEPQQRSESGVVVPVETVDWRGLDEAELERRREAFLASDRARGFDLRRAPLMRVTVFRCATDRCEVVWTVHHILVDGRSMAIVLAEAFASYAVLRGGEPSRLGPPGPPLRECVEWLGRRAHLASSSFFEEWLRGKTAPTPLPLAEPAARPLPHQGVGTVRRVVDERVLAAARALTQRRPQISMGTLIHAAWALVLSRLTGDQDVLFGTVRACRGGMLGGRARQTVGLLMNTLPLRVSLGEDGLVAEFLDQVRQHALDLRPHEHAVLAEIQAHSDLPPGAPLFETLLMFENRELNQELRQAHPAWKSRSCTLHEQPSLPLTVTVFEGETLEVRLLFARSRFREPVVERIAAYLIAAMDGLAGAGEHTRLGEVDILSSDERHRILVEWNDTVRSFPEGLCIHEAFEQQVALRPADIAVECGDATLTYAELEARANRLAHALIARGARPGVYIGVCLSRGFGLVVTLLAIAKAGAAYVPLDPDYPAERLAFMLADAEALLVVVDARHRALFAAPALVVDGADMTDIAAMPPTRPPNAAEPTDACYAIYTSGSTGRPKGVVLTHRAVVNTLDWVNRTFGVGPGDRLLFVTSPSFDLSVYDLFGSLGAGATVVVATSDWLQDPAVLARAVTERGITIWDSAPAALQRLVPFFPSPAGSAPRSALRLVMLSGDWIPISLPGALKHVFAGVAVHSLGGATEAAIWSNAFPVEQIDPRWTSVPYGRPIQNARYHVLDAKLRPVATGVTGDLYIGGACLAQGYLHRAELTRERFIADPFGAAGDRLYKTGDLARYFDDGNLEFLGRADFQVKIRGYRVELGEVEIALSALPQIREAKCTAYADASGQKALVAYVVMRDGASLNEEAIKAQLASTLPAFMVPGRIAALAALPVSSNGKVDCRALPLVTARAARTPFIAPRNERERRMAAIWRELLRKEDISADDNFFALGGHSLLAVMLVSRVATEFGLPIPLASVLEHPTLEALAASLERADAVTARPRHLVTLNRSGAQPPLVLLSGSGGFGFVFQGLARCLGEEHPLHVLNAIGSQDPSEGYDHTIERMAEIYVPQILEACPQETIVLGGYSFGVLVAFELARQLRSRGRTVPLLVSFDGFAPGFPKLLPGLARVRAHVRTFLDADVEGRRDYLRRRLDRLRTRFYRTIGRPEEAMAPLCASSDADMDLRLRKVAAGLTNARGLYHPQQRDPADLLLIKTGIFEHWIGNSMGDPLYGWQSWVGGDIEVATVPGAHLTMFSESNQARIAELVTAAIARCHPDAPPRSSPREIGLRVPAESRERPDTGRVPVAAVIRAR